MSYNKLHNEQFSGRYYITGADGDKKKPAGGTHDFASNRKHIAALEKRLGLHSGQDDKVVAGSADISHTDSKQSFAQLAARRAGILGVRRETD